MANEVWCVPEQKLAESGVGTRIVNIVAALWHVGCACVWVKICLPDAARLQPGIQR